MNQLPTFVVFILGLLALALAVAAVLMPFVVLAIDSRLAKTLKATQDAAAALKSMESMMRNGR